MAVITTGFFDGVHVGHRSVISALVREASRRREESVVVTFWPHPRLVLGRDPEPLALLNTLEEKTSMLKGLGVDRVEVLGFTREFSSMDAEEYFATVVRDRFHGSSVILGYDNRVGRQAPGDASEDIAASAARAGLEVIRTEPETAGGLAVSSTRIRRALDGGDVAGASAMLGYDYTLSSEVVHGKHLGRTIGFPTANMSIREIPKLIPQTGVYLTRVRLGDRVFDAMTNVGPTDVESHLFGFDEDIYGERPDVSFRMRLREMKAFGSMEELRLQLMDDMEKCKNLI